MKVQISSGGSSSTFNKISVDAGFSLDLVLRINIAL